MNENVKKLLKVLEKSIKEATTVFLFEDLSEKEKLEKRVYISKDLKRRGIEVPPDNIDII